MIYGSFGINKTHPQYFYGTVVLNQNISADGGGGRRREEEEGGGRKPEIPRILMLYSLKPVLYLNPVSKCPETTEGLVLLII